MRRLKTPLIGCINACPESESIGESDHLQPLCHILPLLAQRRRALTDEGRVFDSKLTQLTQQKPPNLGMHVQ